MPSCSPRCEADPYFELPPPKSTGRDHFNLEWLERHLEARTYAPADVQRTLVALTGRTVVAAIDQLCSGVAELLVCGGGANNALLIREAGDAISLRGHCTRLRNTAYR